jgi:glycosyltransferase involved in cell wall biosynthesis
MIDKTGQDIGDFSIMRILFLATWFPYPCDSGSNLRVDHLIRALAARHEVTLLSFAFGTAAPERAAELQECCAAVQPIWRNPFSAHPLAQAFRFALPLPAVSLPVPDMVRAVRQMLDRKPFDVIVASTTVMATYALMGGQTTRVLEEHNSMTRWMRERYRSQSSSLQRWRCWVSWQKTRAYEASLFRRFHLCTMVSEEDRQASCEFLRADGDLVQVVPNGVDCLPEYPKPVPPGVKQLIFNGALTYSANYDAMRYFLSDIYPLIRQREPGVALTITGSYAGVDLNGLRLDPSVSLSGLVEDIRALVAQAAVCVVPIREGSGTRLKILEAMAVGTPVVSTAKGAEGLAVADGVHLLLAENPEAFADHTLQILREPDLRQRLLTNARQWVEQHHAWSDIGPRFVDLVEGAARRRTAGDGRV